MRTESLAAAGFTALAVALAIAGIVTVGGPAQGRLEARDQARLGDLDLLAAEVQCRAEDGILPDTLGQDAVCLDLVRFVDRSTGAAYRYERLSDDTFRVCAEFEAPGALQSRPGFSPETGCITRHVR